MLLLCNVKIKNSCRLQVTGISASLKCESNYDDLVVILHAFYPPILNKLLDCIFCSAVRLGRIFCCLSVAAIITSQE